MKLYRKLYQLAALLIPVLAITCSVLPVSADVTYTTSKEADSNRIGITGCPDFYPYEYYNEDTGEYEGVFPEIYEMLSERSGLDFEYVDCSSSDQRLVDEKTGYAQIISAYIKDEKEMDNYQISDPIEVLSYDDNGKTVTICLAFGKYADEETIQKVTEAMDTVTDEEIKSLMAKYINASTTGTDTTLFIVIIIALLVVIAGVGAILFALVARNRKNKAMIKEKELLDVLTGIGNKKYFEQEFNRLIAFQYKASYVMAYIGFDIKRVNKYYGEKKAEEQLCHAAGILTGEGKNQETAARIAGGAFGVMHVCSTEAEAKDWADEVLSRLNVYVSQFERDYAPKFKAGVYRLRAGSWDYEKAVKTAMRCYELAVENGVDVYVSTDEMDKQSQMDEVLSHEIDKALAERQIVQYLQPIVRADNEQVMGAEGLARWQHPTMGLLSPGRFVQMMIDEGKIVELDMYLFEESCRKQEQWKKEGKSFRLSTNFTRLSITSDDYIERVTAIAAKYNFNRGNLVVEITEDSLENNKEVAIKNMAAIKELGFLLALDDLGSGFTFFSDLKDYPLDLIKMDRDMLLGATDDKGKSLMGGIIGVCKDLSMGIICEGIETREQYELVKAMGCDFIQGFFFFKPLPPEEAAKYM